MQRGMWAATALLLALTSVSAPAQIGVPVSDEARDALVEVVTKTLKGWRTSTGFAIGDGTLMVTAWHTVFDSTMIPGRHQMQGMVALLSPYLGEACDAELIAAAPELDLAILQSPWQGHPSLRLADDENVLMAERVVVVSMGETFAEGSASATSATDWPEAQATVCPVDFVGLRRGVQRVIYFTMETAAGQSGSPVLLADAPLAAGCLSGSHDRQLSVGGKFVGVFGVEGVATAAAQIRRLVAEAGEDLTPANENAPLPRAADGIEVVLNARRTIVSMMDGREQEACDAAEALVQSRPECAVAHRLAAMAVESTENPQAAQVHYEEALGLNPDSVMTRILYAQFLHTTVEDDDRSLEVVEPLWEARRALDLTALFMVNVLQARDEDTRCIEILQEALAANPRNCYLWMQLGGICAQQEDYRAAVAHFTRAVELKPDDEQCQRTLQRAQEAAAKGQAVDQ